MVDYSTCDGPDIHKEMIVNVQRRSHAAENTTMMPKCFEAAGIDPMPAGPMQSIMKMTVELDDGLTRAAKTCAADRVESLSDPVGRGRADCVPGERVQRPLYGFADQGWPSGAWCRYR